MTNIRIPDEYFTNTVGPNCEWDKKVMEAFAKTPRHKFLDEAMYKMAYVDDALPIGYGQTISKPSTVAYMTKALELESTHKVLEIGTGSGFQAAVLARLCDTVYTVERIGELHRRTYQIIKRIPLRNVKMKLEPVKLGWDEYAPYDRIICTAEGKSVPQELLDQLADGGLMLIPVNGKLVKITKNGSTIAQEPLKLCSFVDFVGT
ncbi:protein-L-isoaspartate(D-aspartate) O-methyltransferase [Seleniivibrio sp.]|uniref:protein-L-isoaspartate(D-aspartate) O-methyltransferase n=1 Tax=Seleniivibrio sp. TaxID=2898801 RepID=UPI0025D2555F|nr:protein-L-isoaspartate(D-aspartate) O-methyltransferase [Seleniivibrio sp.]MCD8553533.1 protein-L-isoaspartate(D-aspartate) O-methyltransferase [Seleniivibrio sp.]